VAPPVVVPDEPALPVVAAVVDPVDVVPGFPVVDPVDVVPELPLGGVLSLLFPPQRNAASTAASRNDAWNDARGLLMTSPLPSRTE